MLLSIVIPTIVGREHWLEKSLAAIKNTVDFPYEILVEHDHAVCGTAWNAGIERAKGDYILLSADDLLPVAGWFEAAKHCVDQGFLPSAVVLNPNGTIQSCGDTSYLVPTGTEVTMTRVPFASRKQIEKIYPILPIHYGCVPIDHRILTKRGFRNYNELIIGEPVLALDVETHKIHWTPLRNVSTYPFDGELHTLNIGRGRIKENFAFTENHTWPTLNMNNGRDVRKLTEGRKLNANYGIVRMGDFQGSDSVLSERHARLLGWIASDGCIQRDGEIMWISQSPSKHNGSYLDEIVELVGRDPQPYIHKTGTRVVNLLAEDRHELQRFVKSKTDISKVAPLLSRESAEAMLDSIWKGDGWLTAAGQRVIAQHVHWEIRETIQILAILSGTNATIGTSENGRLRESTTPFGTHTGTRLPDIALRQAKYLWTRPDVLGRMPYKGTVWCPTTDYGTWYVEHNGACLPTGNTDNYFSYRGRMNNWDSVVVQTYMFIHHYATEGRLNSRILEDLRIYWQAAGLDEETELQKLEWA